jgi:hypothetical protein
VRKNEVQRKNLRETENTSMMIHSLEAPAFMRIEIQKDSALIGCFPRLEIQVMDINKEVLGVVHFDISLSSFSPLAQ